MRLRNILSRLSQPISPELTRLLALLDREGSIKSTDQIVFTEKTTVLRLAIHQQESECKDTPHLVLSPRELDVAYQSLLELCLAIDAARPISADVFLEVEEENAQDLHWDGTGLEGLDEVLHGFEGRGILELTGKAGTGKTLLSLHIVLRHLSRDPSATCTWIDTRASFSALRAQQILQALAVTEADSVLERLHIVDCFDVDELRSVLRDIDNTLAFSSLVDKSVDLDDDHDITNDGPVELSSSSTVRIMVIDTLSNLLTPIITGSTTQGHAEINALMAGLQDMVRRYSLLAIIAQTPVSALPTFPASAFSTTNIKPPLGASFTYFPDISVLLQKTTDVFVMDVHERRMMTGSTVGPTAAGKAAGGEEGNGSRIVVEVIKNRTGPSSTWVMFQTDGIRMLDVTAT